MSERIYCEEEGGFFPTAQFDARLDWHEHPPQGERHPRLRSLAVNFDPPVEAAPMSYDSYPKPGGEGWQ